MTTTETPMTLSEYLRAGTAHASCSHPMTKAGRAACRRQKIKDTTETIVNHTFVFTRRARAEGCVNTIAEITLWEVAQEHGYEAKEWDPKLAVRLVKENARLMGETDLLADDMR